MFYELLKNNDNQLSRRSRLSVLKALLLVSVSFCLPSCLTTSAIRSATNVDYFSGSDYDKFERIDSIYFIRDSLLIVKIKGENFYDRSNQTAGDSIYYSIPTKTNRKIRKKLGIRFGTDRVIKNNDREYKVSAVFTYRMITVFEKILSAIYIYNRNSDSVEGWNGDFYVYNLKRKHESTSFPKVNLSKGCIRSGGLPMEYTSRKRMLYSGAFIGKRGHRKQIDRDTVLEEISGGYYFPLNRDSIFFFDKSMYNETPNGYKFRIIPKEERSFGYCFVNRNNKSYRVVYINIPRSYNRICKPAKLLLLPLTIIADIPLQALWLPVGLVIEIETGYGCIPEVETFRK